MNWAGEVNNQLFSPCVFVSANKVPFSLHGEPEGVMAWHVLHFVPFTCPDAQLHAGSWHPPPLIDVPLSLA